MKYDAATIEYYEAAAPRYTLSTALDRHRHLDPFLDRLNQGARVLELGCGNGRDAKHMVDRGFEVDATDGTAAMVSKANASFDLKARQMRFDELKADQDYDAVWAHACLLHLPRAALSDALARIHRSLRPRGWHFANFKLCDAQHPNEGRDPLGRWTNLPDPKWLNVTYLQAGFEMVETDIYAGNGSDGVQRDWMALTARKA
ncbi:class I SAM-dependent methyltransferase [Erythrobacter sp. F6033]|uniref:class I SAM-dependent methyltransferase n=1 Tax=Erythrobacter sp. F6033 TaxID=2926401 RepID=UPI001FF4DC73|nr:class I SAM-dependent methyltransferase [Erythrobacter sp. F6033]